MKKITLLIFILISLLQTSCTVYENFTFEADGKIKYDMTFKISDVLMSMANGRADDFLPDSTMYLSDIFIEKKGKMNLTEKQLSYLKNISMLKVETKKYPEEGLIVWSLYGDFKNSKEMNLAFEAMNNIQLEDKAPQKRLNMDDIIPIQSCASKYYWDGSTMTRKAIFTPETEARNEVDSIVNSKMEKMMKGIQSITTYNFPAGIVSVSNPDVLLSQDKKKASIQYLLHDLMQNPKLTNIEISTKQKN